MNRDFRYWLRWIAVLPGGALAGLFATFVLHWMLYLSLSEFIEPYPALPERLLTPLVGVAAFIVGGSRIAPQYRFEAAVGLFGLSMALLGGFVSLTLWGGNWSMGRPTYFYGGGLGPVMSLIGGVAGLYMARKESTSHSQGAPTP